MAHEIKPAKSEKKPYNRMKINDDIEEIVIPKKKTLKDYAVQAMERVASNRIGQIIIEKNERMLKIIELTLKWSLPADESDLELERPLPWIFFLSLIVWLRFFRIWLTVVSYFISSQPVTLHSLICFLQNRRRNLRAFRMQGLKSIENRELLSIQDMSCSCQKANFITTFRNFIISSVCTLRPYRATPARVELVTANKEELVRQKIDRSAKRPREDESFELNLTVPEMLEKYANENSDCDSDYVPIEDEEDEEDEDDNEGSCNSSEEEEAAEESIQKSETTIDAEESKIKDNEHKENGESKQQSQPVSVKSLPDADATNDEMHTPEEMPANKNDAPEVEQQSYDNSKSNATLTEAAPPHKLSTPKSTPQPHLTVPLEEENERKSTPGHESAASTKPSLITDTRSGSPQDFHSIFHPAPLVKGSTTEVQTSTPKEIEQLEITSPEINTSGQQERRNSNQFNNHNTSNRPNQFFQYNSNNKKRYNRNRRI